MPGRVAVVATSSSYPLKGKNRTRLEVAEALSDHTGGINNDAQLRKAKRCFDRAVDDYNDVSWKFNLTSQDITLVSGTRSYALDSVFRTPKSCHLVDASSDVKTDLTYSEFSLYSHERSDQSQESGEPKRYYFQNAHQDGLIYFWPEPLATLAYPTARLFYHYWIEKTTADGDRLDVPRDVDEAIFEKALELFLRVEKGPGHAQEQRMVAEMKRLMVERAHRDYKAIDVRWA